MKTTTAQLINDYAGRKIASLQERYVQRESSALGQLAALRQTGLQAGDDPRVWTLVFEGMPPELEGKGSLPSYAEQAILAALHLFAHHQQSMTEPMHRTGVPLATAVGILARARAQETELDEATLKRFRAAALAQGHEGRVRLLRQLTSMMRANRSPTIGLDYGALAADLYRFHFPKQAPNVRLSWARQLHRSFTPITDSNTLSSKES